MGNGRTADVCIAYINQLRFECHQFIIPISREKIYENKLFLIFIRRSLAKAIHISSA